MRKNRHGVRRVADYHLGAIGGYHFRAGEFDGVLYADEFPRPAVGDHEAVNSAADILDSYVLRDLGYGHPRVPALHEKILCPFLTADYVEQAFSFPAGRHLEVYGCAVPASKGLR